VALAIIGVGMKHVVIGTAGHIDHGKSALVRALTGTDPDRLKEEKERGITIDLGFAFLKDESGLSLGFIDVPGHERFVKNMLAGVGGIDLVMLVVAADESVMPQTREHFAICRLLRVPRGVVVVTKSDLVDEELRELAMMEARELVAGSFLEGASVVPVSSRTGEGMDVLKSTLVELARGATPRSATGPFRLPVDRVFSMKGFGTVVTGTLLSGGLRQDDEVEILPRGGRARVRGLQVHGEKQGFASAGQRTAVNLQGIEVSDLERGDSLVEPDAFRPTMMLDCALEVLDSSAIPVKDLTRVHVHLGTAQVLARARVLGSGRAIAPGDRGMVQLRLEAPVVAARGDRIIVRRYSPLDTIAGGLVLDAYPVKHPVSRPAEVDRLALLEKSDVKAAAARFVAESGLAGVTEDDLRRRLGIGRSELQSTIEELLRGQAAIAASKSPRILVEPGVVAALGETVEAELRRFQKKNPLLAGMPKSELREKVSGRAPLEVFELVVQRLAESGRLRASKELLSTADHRIHLSEDESRAREVLVEHYRASGYSPKSLEEIALGAKLDSKLLERIRRVVIKEGTLVQIADGIVFHRDVLEELKSSVRGCKTTRDRIDVAFFKEMAGVTRKHAIPLLEWLDRERVTQRAGNDRVIL
jgi:selenocysteine-specific elongation factor